jgi:hypothetical protein
VCYKHYSLLYRVIIYNNFFSKLWVSVRFRKREKIKFSLSVTCGVGIFFGFIVNNQEGVLVANFLAYYLEIYFTKKHISKLWALVRFRK